jgi:uncharacterized membrane protein YqjE
MQQPKYEEELSIRELISNLAQNMNNMIRKEIELAQVEMKAKARSSVKGIAMIGIGAVVLFGGFLFLLLTAVYALATVLPAWAAALIVAVVVLAAGAIATAAGIKRLKQTDLKPTQAIESIKESRIWMKQQLT